MRNKFVHQVLLTYWYYDTVTLTHQTRPALNKIRRNLHILKDVRPCQMCFQTSKQVIVACMGTPNMYMY